MDTHILVDYYNLPQKLLNAGVAAVIAQINTLVLATLPDVTETHVRLYGGWYDHSGLSNDGTRLTQEIMQNFPRAYRGEGDKVRYVKCEIASALIQAKGDLFFSTVRPRRGMTRFVRIPHPAACIDVAKCTISVVLEWSKKGCPTTGCQVANTDAFVCNQQKLVDILLCCDLLVLATAGSSMRVFLVSEDDDFIPALVQARSSGARIWHVRTKPSKIRVYDAILQRNGVQIVYI